MLRLLASSAFICIGCALLGLGKLVPLTSNMESFFLAMAAMAATVFISSYDAYETQAPLSED